MVSLVLRRTTGLISAPEIVLLLVAIVWGTSYGLTKSALMYTTVLLFISIRFGATFLLLVPVVIADFAKGKNKHWQVALPTGAILTLIFFFEVYGVSQTTASNAAFLISLNVIFTALLEAAVNRKVPQTKLLLLSLLSTLGVLLLTYHPGLEISFNQGDMCIIIAAMLRAVMVVSTRKLTENRQITNSTLTALQALVVAVCTLSLTLAMDDLASVQLPSHSEFWMITAFLVLFCTLFAFYAQNYAVRKISPTKASLLMGSEPLFGALFSMLWLGEALTWIQTCGGLLLLGAVMAASVSSDS